jgi:hypothetical protein
MWVAGVGVEWQWTPTRAVTATLNYIQMGDAPVTSPSIPGIGSVTGRYTDRGTIFLEVGVSFGTGPASREFAQVLKFVSGSEVAAIGRQSVFSTILILK